MAAIHVLIENPADRTAITTLLEALGYTVETGADRRDAALYIVSDHALPDHRERLRTIKQAQSPVFCPVILLRRQHTQLNLPAFEQDPNATDAPALIDDVMTAPVTKPVLARRVANLVVRRNQTQDLARKNDRLEDFASMVSHDLRNPLSVAEGYLELEMGDREHASENLRTVADAHDRMRDLIDDILMLARDGEVIGERRRTDLSAVAERGWENVDSPTQTLVVDVDADIDADADRLQQLFENLFRNAVEHGGRDVRVTVGDLPSGFYVEDTGAGIPAAKLGRLFDRGSTTGEDGPGIGLRIVEQIVDAHGWDVTAAESDEGGARFEITGVDRATQQS